MPEVIRSRFSLRLTRSAVGLCLAGVLLLLGAYLLGRRDVMAAAVVCFAFVFAALLGTLLETLLLARGVELSRGLSTTRARQGEPVEVKVSIQGRRAKRADILEQQPDVEPLVFSGNARYRYTPTTRGLKELGPALLREPDPFALVSVTRVVGAPSSVLVGPQLVDLEALGQQLNFSTGATGGIQDGFLGGQSGVGVRPWRIGDQLRRVHWPSTARRDEVMVREEEEEAGLSALLIMDDRLEASAPPSALPSFERRLSVLASVLLVLNRAGYQTQLHDTSGHSYLDPDYYLATVQGRQPAQNSVTFSGASSHHPALLSWFSTGITQADSICVFGPSQLARDLAASPAGAYSTARHFFSDIALDPALGEQLAQQGWRVHDQG